ncbi:hypothetical protein UA32_12545 [Photobacterium angustum]|uniref:Uncharacterized protein n=1 Tax=Photobacterium angustum TaxID=661 RepID=A0ABX5H1V0_PHOAN|nr:hypothetical protein [Photobacterium angustum]KJG37775.1 hypothetical protein UA32_12545 [Photobacterium angustum]PSX07044.1 hypothetical protein C0W27_15865 [Photobacterium angustum]
MINIKFWQNQTNMNLTWLAALILSLVFIDTDHTLKQNTPAFFLFAFSIVGFLREGFLKKIGFRD